MSFEFKSRADCSKCKKAKACAERSVGHRIAVCQQPWSGLAAYMKGPLRTSWSDNLALYFCRFSLVSLCNPARVALALNSFKPAAIVYLLEAAVRCLYRRKAVGFVSFRRWQCHPTLPCLLRLCCAVTSSSALQPLHRRLNGLINGFRVSVMARLPPISFELVQPQGRCWKRISVVCFATSDNHSC